MILFHITDTRLIPKILREGLKPKLGSKSSQCENEPAVFLFTSIEAMENAMLNWFMDEVDDDVPLAVLKITIPDSWKENVFINTNANYEAICKIPVPPKFIQTYHTEIDI